MKKTALICRYYLYCCSRLNLDLPPMYRRSNVLSGRSDYLGCLIRAESGYEAEADLPLCIRSRDRQNHPAFYW